MKKGEMHYKTRQDDDDKTTTTTNTILRGHEQALARSWPKKHTKIAIHISDTYLSYINKGGWGRIHKTKNRETVKW